ncbi:MAG: protein arginine kinase [Clostridiales bacterium]|nr:protein arginine kinase [Clostridiales bacterium]
MLEWFNKKGPEGEIVLSTRIRLARNINEYPFPVRLDAKQKEQVCEKIKEAMLNSNSCIAKDFQYLKMDTLSNAQAIAMAEHHLISPEFATNTQSRGLLINKDSSVSIMLCEEDHIRLQVMKSGFDLDSAYELADKIDTLLDNSLHFAFDEKLGYLTQCPTNLGTGMRASVMLHLPALTKCGQINSLATTISKLGLTIRGAYGEGTQPQGDIYQLSNQVSLGISEKAAIDNLKSITKQVIAQEEKLREQMKNDDEVIDKIWRSLGILKNARILNTAEFMELISFVRMGICLGIVDFDIETINTLISQMQPATINANLEKALTPKERDLYRAEKVRQAFN